MHLLLLSRVRLRCRRCMALLHSSLLPAPLVSSTAAVRVACLLLSLTAPLSLVTMVVASQSTSSFSSFPSSCRSHDLPAQHLPGYMGYRRFYERQLVTETEQQRRRPQHLSLYTAQAAERDCADWQHDRNRAADCSRTSYARQSSGCGPTPPLPQSLSRPALSASPRSSRAADCPSSSRRLSGRSEYGAAFAAAAEQSGSLSRSRSAPTASSSSSAGLFPALSPSSLQCPAESVCRLPLASNLLRSVTVCEQYTRYDRDHGQHGADPSEPQPHNRALARGQAGGSGSERLTAAAPLSLSAAALSLLQPVSHAAASFHLPHGDDA